MKLMSTVKSFFEYISVAYVPAPCLILHLHPLCSAFPKGSFRLFRETQAKFFCRIFIIFSPVSLPIRFTVFFCALNNYNSVRFGRILRVDLFPIQALIFFANIATRTSEVGVHCIGRRCLSSKQFEGIFFFSSGEPLSREQCCD